MGSIFWYPIISATFTSFAQWAYTHGYHIYGTSAHGNQDYRAIERYETPLILLMGSERDGLNAAQTAICEVMLLMPMKGHVTSLNLAVAAGVMLYSIMNKM
jgi:TrmH family RNA methyltransferase